MAKSCHLVNRNTERDRETDIMLNRGKDKDKCKEIEKGRKRDR